MKRELLNLLLLVAGGGLFFASCNSDDDAGGNDIPVAVRFFYPQDGSKVDFVAYYPYKLLQTNYIYPIDVKTQTTPTDIDILYSNIGHGILISQAEVRPLSRKLLNILFVQYRLFRYNYSCKK
ncbi:MAG: fimbrillin family protein [Dysgonamonadaceae bacterium]|jgi:hypothetical protein|nr:fimbrillin family protein [Dysgonamonadaceae bacterium]